MVTSPCRRREGRTLSPALRRKEGRQGGRETRYSSSNLTGADSGSCHNVYVEFQVIHTYLLPHPQYHSVVLHHHCILNHKQHPHWLGISFAITQNTKTDLPSNHAMKIRAFCAKVPNLPTVGSPWRAAHSPRWAAHGPLWAFPDWLSLSSWIR